MLQDHILAFEQWADSKIGRLMVAEQQAVLERYLPTCFGYHLMQLSMSRQISLFSNSKIQHCFALGSLAGGNIKSLSDENLPLPSESIDVAILHHVLEYSSNPHVLLREVTRALMPSGKIMIIGFNPYSPIFLQRLYGRLKKQPMWQGRLLSVNRIEDWLAFMDCRLEAVNYGFYHWPVEALYPAKIPFLARFLEYKQWPLGNFYVLLAEKQISRLTPIHWQGGIKKPALALAKTQLVSERSKKP